MDTWVIVLKTFDLRTQTLTEGEGSGVSDSEYFPAFSYVYMRDKELNKVLQCIDHPYQGILFAENAESTELVLKVSPCLEASSLLEDVKQCNTSLYLCTVSPHTLSLEGTNVRFKCSLQLC